MKILVYASTDPDCPKSMSFMARFLVGGKLQPVSITAETAQDAIKKAQTFWDKEQEIAAKKLGRALPKMRTAQ